jgi:hypothetical protein
MAKLRPGRFTADVDGDVVVFLIGMRVNRPWKVTKWWPVFAAMPVMLRWLAQHPQEGLLSARFAFMNGGPASVQYWRSAEDLNRFARLAEGPHLGPWRAYNKAIGSSGDVGVWHETYVVKSGQLETVYANMPVVGLAEATASVPIGLKGHSAARRMGLTVDDDSAVPTS